MSDQLYRLSPELRKRVEKAAEAGDLAFWAEIVEHFPEAKSGDFDIWETHVMREKMIGWVLHWITWNTQLAPEEDQQFLQAVTVPGGMKGK